VFVAICSQLSVTQVTTDRRQQRMNYKMFPSVNKAHDQATPWPDSLR